MVYSRDLEREKTKGGLKLPKRISSGLGLVVVFTLGFYLAYKASQLYQYQAVFAGSYTYQLLFTSFSWLIPVSILGGIFAGAASEREQSQIIDGQVLRHDGLAFLIHWSHAIATLLLVVTGVYLGFLFIPRLVFTPQSVGYMLNLHFVGVVVLLFSVSCHLTDLLLAGKLKEHWPEAGDFKAALAHYAAKVGIGTAPPEGKYLASEKLSYPLWVLSVGLVILTGLTKISAHVWNLPGGLMEVATLLHDIGALLVILNLAAHIFFSSLVPWSRPLLRSMLTGYVSEEYVRKNHPKWYAELSGQPLRKTDSTEKGSQLPFSS